MIENCKKFITPISIKGWTLPSDINGLLDFSLNVYHLLVKDFDPLSFNLTVASGLVTFPDYRFCLFLVFCQFTQSLSTKPSCLSEVPGH